MYCLICEPKVELEKVKFTERDRMFYQYYMCPNCNEEHVCSSQSGDMIQEYLDLVNE